MGWWSVIRLMFLLLVWKLQFQVLVVLWLLLIVGLLHTLGGLVGVVLVSLSIGFLCLRVIVLLLLRFRGDWGSRFWKVPKSRWISVCSRSWERTAAREARGDCCLVCLRNGNLKDAIMGSWQPTQDSDCQGFWNPHGLWVGYAWVGVWVGLH